MNRMCFLVAACSLMAGSVGTAADDPFECVDLEPHITNTLVQARHLTLEQGEHTFDGIPFQIERGVIQLGSRNLANWPERVEGIPINRTFAKLHLLHATGWSAEDGELIGEYVVHYADGTFDSIPVIYGEDVRDWWLRPGDPAPKRSRVAWVGDSEEAGKFGARNRLYHTTWTNPEPHKRVVSIDYIARKDDTGAAPFCVGMTLEERSIPAPKP